MCTPEPAPAGRVRVNVGGRVFETTASTLASAGRETMLGAMMDASWNAGGRAALPEYFIDRDPACFAALLDMLRSGELHVPPGVPERLLFREAHYYGLLDRVRAAQIGEFDGDRLRLAASLPPGRAPADATAVRAAPDGGCCVAQGTTVRLYNWMLEELRPAYLTPEAPILHATYLDASTLIIGASGGGVAAFSTRTGDLTHDFRVAHGLFTPLALESDKKSTIFASCKALNRPSEHDGIGTWDCSTQAGSFFPDRPGFAFSDATKLQWLETTNALLMVSMEAPRKDRPFVALVDFRDRSVVWSCSDQMTLNNVVDAVMMEDERSVCVVNKFHDLGFLEIRKNGSAAVQSWRPGPLGDRTGLPVSHYPKLATHGEQLLASRNDTVSVYSGPQRVLTSTLRGSGGAIGDLAIGGDRLFALHKEKNVVDVWEALPPPII